MFDPDMHDFEELSPILDRMLMAQSQRRAFDFELAAVELDLSVDAVRQRADVVQAWGLALSGEDEGGPPLVLDAGRQYLASRGQVDRDVLRFLPLIINDLHTRSAFIHAGTVMLDEFRGALLNGSVVDHARWIVPDAFEPAITRGHSRGPVCSCSGADGATLGRRAGRLRR